MDRVWLSPLWLIDLTGLFLGLTWFAIVVGVLVVERRRRKRNLPAPSADPTCPACGYVVIGLAGNVCPECGSDLASIGVVRRDDNRTAPVARLALWTILFALPAFLVWRHVHPRLPVLSEHTVTQTFSGPVSGAYRSLEVRTIASRWHWRNGAALGAPRERVEFRLQRLDNSQLLYVMRVRPIPDTERSLRLRQFMAAATPQPVPTILDRRPLLEWMRTQGVDADDPAVQAEVETIAAALDGRLLGIWGLRVAPAFAGAPIVQTGARGKPWWMYAACAAIALVIWSIGARLVTRRRTLPYERTALPAAGAPAATAPDVGPTPGVVIGR